MLLVLLVMNELEELCAPVRHVKLPVLAAAGRFVGHGTGVGSAEGVGLKQLAASRVLHPSDAQK